MSTASNLSTLSFSKKKKEKRANGQGSIYPKKGTNKYIVAVHDVLPNGEIKRRRVTVNSMKAAEAFLYEFRPAQRQKQILAAPTTIVALTAKWLASSFSPSC